MNKEIQKLLFFFAKAILIVIVLDFALGKGLEIFYNRMSVGEKARANYFIRKDLSDVIVFGSSRALYHYHAGVLADSLQTTVYNAGRSNQTILYHLALLKTILKRHTPKMVILDVNEEELVKSQKKYELLSALLPYCHYDEDIRALYRKANPGYGFWSWSRSLPYNSSVFATLYRGITRGKDNDIHGFLNHDGVFKDSLKTTDNCAANYPLDPMLEQSFSEFVALCKARNITLFVSVSPRFVQYKCRRPEYEALQNLAKQDGVAIHDYEDLYDDGSYFSDPSHLNSKGALAFSKSIAPILKASLHPQQ
ncbi:MAG TPA: hypothetical protein VIU12_30020 [Chryseolinea sp.]